MSAKNLQELLDQAGQHRRAAPQLAARRLHLPGRAGRVHQLAPRGDRLARDGGAVRPDATTWSTCSSPARTRCKLISDTGINSVANFPVDMAKQFVPVSPEGGVIGDGILFHLAEEEFVFVGRAPGRQLAAASRAARATTSTSAGDERSPSRPYGKPVTRELWRFQIQGPKAWAGHREAQRRAGRAGQVLPDGPHERRRRAGPHAAPRHGGRARVWSCGVRTRATRRSATTILEAGREFGIEPCGSRAYSANTLESGWIPSPLPAIYTSEELRAYREWLGADSYEATNALAGSFVSDNIEDYYLNPWELGYGSFVKFDHDFIGRDALAAHRPGDAAAQGDPRLEPRGPRQAPGLAGRPGRPRLPVLRPAQRQLRLVQLRLGARRGRHAGRAVAVHRLQRQRAPGLSLATVNPDVPIGAEVRVIWGEPDGGSAKTTVQPHEQLAVRAVVSPAPYSEMARETYHAGWRTAATS